MTMRDRAEQNYDRNNSLVVAGDGVADPTTTLAAHGTYEHMTADLFRCECGFEFLWQTNFPDTMFAAHQLAMLAEDGWAIVKLPEPGVFPGGDLEWTFATADGDGWVNRNADGAIEINIANDDGTAADLGGLPTCAEGLIPTEMAPALAAALLAAAEFSAENL